MNKNKWILSTCLILTITATGCGNNSNNQGQETAKNTQNVSNNSENSTTINPQKSYVNEAQYSSTELELIKLINQSTKYRNENNKKEYLKLFTSDSLIRQINKNKIIDIKIDHIGDISEKQASIETTVTTDNSDPSSHIYVFHKENNNWLIYDID